MTLRKRSSVGALLAGLLISSPGGALAQSPLDDPNVLAMQGNAFQPVEKSVPLGTTLTWVNLDPEDHDVIARDLSFESPVLKPGESWSFTFTAPGSYSYLCDLHENMEGVVTVVDVPAASATASPSMDVPAAPATEPTEAPPAVSDSASAG